VLELRTRGRIVTLEMQRARGPGELSRSAWFRFEGCPGLGSTIGTESVGPLKDLVSVAPDT
jgi:hypothetical protein